MKDIVTKKVAILGTESSHARAFAQLLQKNKYVELIGAYGTEPEANRKFKEAYGVNCSSLSPDAYRGKVDGVLITARNGADHLALARPYLTSGMTVFVDKPLCNETAEAEELIKLAKQNGVRLCGGSSLKHAPSLLRLRHYVQTEPAPIVGGSLSAPVEMESVYGGFLFYAPHLVEMALTVFGNKIRSVRAIRHGESVTALLNYGDFCVSLFFGCDAYTASVSFRTHEKHCGVSLESIPSLYAKELAEFCALLLGKEEAPDPSALADHVRIANAIRLAYETQEEIVPD